MSSSRRSVALGPYSILAGRSLLFSIGMLASTIAIAVLVIVCGLLPFPTRYRISQWWCHFNLWWLRITCGIDYQVSGAEHLPRPEESPAIVMSKHQSAWEALFFHQYLPPVAWVVKRELLWLPLFGWALALLRPIAINRQAGAASIKQVLRRGVAHLRQGQWVVIFPEGTRVAPGTHQRYGIGGAALAVHSGCPILPVALNSGEFWPRRSFIKKPGTVQVVFGPLLDSRGRSPQELTQQVAEWIESTMPRLEAARFPSSQ